MGEQTNQDQFLSILREILEQYALVFQVLRDIDKSIGEGNREIREKISDLEGVLRSQIDQLGRIAASLSDLKEPSEEMTLLKDIQVSVSRLDKCTSTLSAKLIKLVLIVSVISSTVGFVWYHLLSLLDKLKGIPTG